MQTVTVTFKNSRNQDQTATFDVYDCATTDKKLQREMTLTGAYYLGREEWQSEDYVSLKMAAAAAGLENKRVILVEK